MFLYYKVYNIKAEIERQLKIYMHKDIAQRGFDGHRYKIVS